MKYLILFLISFNLHALVPTPQEARDAVTKALSTEGWTLDQRLSRFERSIIVLDHPNVTSRKQIVLTRNTILFRDYSNDQESRSYSVLHNAFFESIFKTYGTPPTEIATAVNTWVE